MAKELNLDFFTDGVEIKVLVGNVFYSFRNQTEKYVKAYMSRILNRKVILTNKNK